MGAGDSLVLVDGIYEVPTTGMLVADCGVTAPQGLTGAPVSVRAEHERRAELRSAGTTEAIELRGCRYWNLTGLTARSADTPGSEGGAYHSVVGIVNSASIRVRRMLSSHSNRYFGSPMFYTVSSDDVLFEECEASHFNDGAFVSYYSNNLTVRRCYANPRNHLTLPGCTYSQSNDEPYCGTARGVLLVDSGRDRVVENSILQGTAVGVDMIGFGSGTRVTGTIALDVQNGVRLSDRGGFPSYSEVNISDVLLHGTAVGVDVKTVAAVTMNNVSSSQFNLHLRTEASSEATCADNPSGCRIDTADALYLGGALPMSIMPEFAWSIDHAHSEHSEVFPTGDTDISDQSPPITNSTVGPVDGLGLGANDCALFVPADHPLARAGSDGGAIGANLLYRVEEGVTTDIPLWDPQTGAFACGEEVEGVNDGPASCRNVHLTLIPPGCDLPTAQPSGCG